MTRDPLVWVVTDQSSNHRAILACIRSVVREFWDVELRHVYVPKNDLVRTKVPGIVRAIREAKGDRARRLDPVLLFRDSECRADRDLNAARQNVAAVVAGLQSTFPNTWGLAFNPMSESAFLLFDEAVAALQARSTDGAQLLRLVKAKRQRQLVNKQDLEDALRRTSASWKRDLDAQMASLLFGETPVACTDRQYTAAVDQIRGVFQAGLQPDPGANAAGGVVPE